MSVRQTAQRSSHSPTIKSSFITKADELARRGVMLEAQPCAEQRLQHVLLPSRAAARTALPAPAQPCQPSSLPYSQNFYLQHSMSLQMKPNSQRSNPKHCCSKAGVHLQLAASANRVYTSGHGKMWMCQRLQHLDNDT